MTETSSSPKRSLNFTKIQRKPKSCKAEEILLLHDKNSSCKRTVTFVNYHYSPNHPPLRFLQEHLEHRHASTSRMEQVGEVDRLDIGPSNSAWGQVKKASDEPTGKENAPKEFKRSRKIGQQ